MTKLDEIIDNFSLLDDWDDRYRYLIELGRTLEPLEAVAHNETNKVRGCASQVWIETTIDRDRDGNPLLRFKGDSDAHLVRGLIALVLALYSGRSAEAIVATEANPVFKQLDLDAHLTPQRSNGVRSMVDRIKRDARATLAAA